MMINFAVLDEADEYPRELGSRHYLPPGAVELPPGVTLAQAAKMRVMDGVWVDRPALVEPSVTVGEAATVVIRRFKLWRGSPTASQRSWDIGS